MYIMFTVQLLQIQSTSYLTTHILFNQIITVLSPKLYLARENLADNDPVIIPYMVVNRWFIALYGIISGSLSANYSWAKYKYDSMVSENA